MLHKVPPEINHLSTKMNLHLFLERFQLVVGSRVLNTWSNIVS